jgi:uncharacterized cupin superfamily protein
MRTMTTNKPALNAGDVEAQRGTLYPSPFAERVRGRERRSLGDAFGLTQFGVSLVKLDPGGESALRHWHTLEDELIYVLSGQLSLITDDGEQVLRPGSVIGFPGGSTNAHHLINRTTEHAEYLVVGTRIEADNAHFPDDDLAWVEIDGTWVAAHKDGTAY